MIYLITEMFAMLIVAIFLGAAIGWIIHRAAHRGENHTLRQNLARQQGQIKQAQTDVSILSNDYDELNRNTQEQIQGLLEENREIPELKSNLEKSQLLVRQMIQRHDAKQHVLTTENTLLSAKLARLEADKGTSQVTETAAETAANTTAKTTANTTAKTNSLDSTDLSPAPDLLGQLRFAASESEDDPFDAVIEIDDELQRELDQTSDPVMNKTGDPTSLFDKITMSDTPDDLQQIFGIGPLTEKALNDLGITQYVHLAELEKPDIERIANALEIGPGRIERDNWVGNARKQLEEVLNQL